MNLSGKTALVTGGARRVGRAISVALAGAGADVIINYRNSEAEAKQLVEELAAAGRSARAVRVVGSSFRPRVGSRLAAAASRVA